MDKTNILARHDPCILQSYLPNPYSHLNNPRDRHHFDQTVKILRDKNLKTVLDIGCYDGWLDFLLIDMGYDVTGIELIPVLVKSALNYVTNKNIDYKIMEGFFQDLEIKDKFDAVICYETLEHIPFEDIPAFIKKMEYIVLKTIIVSLPNQKCEDNIQHQWTPTIEVIHDIFKDKKNFSVTLANYPRTGVPSNWIISYDI